MHHDLGVNKFFFRILPYIISLILGFAIFVVIDVFVLGTTIEAMLVEVGGALVGVPVVFICYEAVSEISSYRLKDIMFKYARINIDQPAKDLAALFVKKFKLKEFDPDFFDNERKRIERGLTNYKGLDVDELQRIYDDFFKVLRNENVYEVIDHDQLHNIFRLNNNLSYLIYELKRKKDKKMILQKIYKIVACLDNWFDYSRQTFLYK